MNWLPIATSMNSTPIISRVRRFASQCESQAATRRDRSRLIRAKPKKTRAVQIANAGAAIAVPAEIANSQTPDTNDPGSSEPDNVQITEYVNGLNGKRRRIVGSHDSVSAIV